MINSITNAATLYASAFTPFQPMRRSVAVITASGDMRRPGCSGRVSMLDVSSIDSDLLKLTKNKVRLPNKIFSLSGYADPGKAGTNLKNNLAPYVSNAEMIETMNFLGECFKPSTLVGCALKAIDKINDTCTEGEKIILVGHSMGARVSDLIIQIFKTRPDLNAHNVKITKFISLCGAHQGSEKAWLARFFCCNRNIAKDLVPDRIADADLLFTETRKTRAYYLAAANDWVIPPIYAAPAGNRITVLAGVSRVNAHIKILNDKAALTWILNILQDL